MTSLKKYIFTLMKVPRSFPFSLSRLRTHIFAALLLSVFLFFFISSSTSLANHSIVITAVTFASRVIAISSYVSPFSPITSATTTHLVSDSHGNCTLPTVTIVERTHGNSRKTRADMIRDLTSCDIFDGKWVLDHSGPLYKPESCPFVDDSFNCFKNGRPDSDYLRYRWKPHGCRIPRFNGRKMLSMLRGKRLVFVGDSLNRNMWESLVCSLRESLKDKSRVFEVSGKHEFRTQGFYSFRFKDYKCSIDFIKSPFLVQEWKTSDEIGRHRETLRLDMIQGSSSMYHDADIIIFNTGHWWTHQKTYKGKGYFQEGGHVYNKLEVTEAYTKALLTWAQWVDSNINSSRTRVFFRGYSASHFKGGQWNSGGSCDGETQPIMNDAYLAPYPWMMKILESVIAEMKTPVFYLNITKMTDYRKDGHPSVHRHQGIDKNSKIIQDCSHWCLPGIPDSWNELLYATLLISHQNLQSTS